MEIMFYYGTMYMGGAERVIASLANDFVKRGDDVSIMVTDGLPAGYLLDERVRFINQNAFASSSRIIDAIKNNIRRIMITRKYMHKIRPDIVVCFNIKQLTFVILTRYLLGIKTIGSERSNPYLAGEGRFWIKMKQIVSHLADGYIFSTEGARDYYPQRVQNKSVIIPNGVFADTIPEFVPSLDQRKGKRVCAVGRLQPVKGFDTLIRAFARFHRNYPQYTLHIYGEGGERKNLSDLISQLGLGGSVFLEGQVQDVPQKLIESSMFVLSSVHEGMPNALIEAMACGLPCIATDCDFGPRELITQGINGLLVPVGDAESMAKAMKRIAEDSLFAENLAQNALRIRETHSREKIMDMFHEYIVSVLRK